MLRFTIISLALLICAVNADAFETILGSEKEVLIVSEDEKAQQSMKISEPSSDDTALAVIGNDTPVAQIGDLAVEGQTDEVVIRAKRYYGCGCGCGCGTCATVDPTATVAACGCGCCGCGYG